MSSITEYTMNKGSPTKSPMNIKMSDVVQFYANKSVLITGATGFLGGVVLEKLLRSCDGIKMVFVLIRGKKGKSMKERYDELIQSSLFERLRREKTEEVLKKIIPIAGDITAPQLDMSMEDQILLRNNVSVVLHMAASVNFDTSLENAITLNTNATVHVVQFCKTMKQLQAFVYTSTAYSYSNRDFIGEQVYPTECSLDNVYHVLNNSPSKTFVDKLSENRPNTYTYTKALAEEYIVNNRGDIPASIVRPSVSKYGKHGSGVIMEKRQFFLYDVVSAINEPVPGWVEGMTGANAIIAVMGKGLLRSWCGDPESIADLIPVDIVANLVIVAAWDAHKRHKKSDNAVKVFNCCSGVQNPINVGDFLNTSLRYTQKHLFDNVFWRPTLFLTKSRVLHKINLLLLHFIPAFIIDIYHWITGKKLRLLRIQKKIWRLASVLEFFTCHEFLFADYNVKSLNDELSQDDRELFNFNIKNLDWNSFLENYILGLKRLK